MDPTGWNFFWTNRWNLHILNDLLTEEKDITTIIPIGLQINLIILRLCLNRTKQLLPELCVLIYNLISAEIKYFRPKSIIFDPKMIVRKKNFATVNITNYFMKKYKRNDIPISELKNFISVGQWGSFKGSDDGRDFVIFDINYEYEIIVVTGWLRINYDSTHLRIFTFEEFVFSIDQPDISTLIHEEKIDMNFFQKIKLIEEKIEKNNP